MDPEIAARFEGLERTIMAELRGVRSVLDNHTIVDRENFEVLGGALTVLRGEFTGAIRDQDEKRRQLFHELGDRIASGDTRLQLLTRDSDRAKGALWVVIGLLGAMVTLAGVGIAAIVNYLVRH